MNDLKRKRNERIRKKFWHMHSEERRRRDDCIQELSDHYGLERSTISHIVFMHGAYKAERKKKKQ